MKVNTMGDCSNEEVTSRCTLRSALILSGSILAIAVPLALVATAMDQRGSAGVVGLAIAAVICLVAGLGAEAIASLVHGAGSPLGALLAGMSVRLVPPLVVGLLLALHSNGREHLVFVGYLLLFYFVTLVLDTWLAVKRVAGSAKTL